MSLRATQPRYLGPNPFVDLEARAKEHWKIHRPSMYAKLKAQRKLSQAARKADELTSEEFRKLVVEEGLSQDQAWELVREKYAFLPPDREDSGVPFEL